ncbi:EAL domain-containing protein [Shewanella avicenniae]|uniref:EAL domain-containing protein n=1 Tax=Shewanella avicenniae TaxID=2814294 RepID=A0ABX7QQ71_9GAMM|nr:EAL domain-containing protein [Shewanella avicenniae]QSX33549.1 EAL domain-containing protein [Shewanella avicenniae]
MQQRLDKNPDLLHQHWWRGTLTYILALVIIALLALLSHYLVQSIVDQQESTARVVNIAGRQRMLSQRITLFASELRQTRTEELHGAELASYYDAISTMSTMHYALMNGASSLNIPTPSSNAIKAMFNQPPTNLHQKVTEFLVLAERVVDASLDMSQRNEAYKQLRQAARAEMLQSLDAVVLQFQRESEAAISQLQRYNRLSLGGMLLTLLIEALFIFRPLLLSLYRREQEYHALLADMDEEIAEQIQFQTFNDPLTHLPNRLSILEKIQSYIELAQHNHSQVIVIYIGVDRFKDINDSLGHDQGDLFLVDLGERLANVAESNRGTVARMASDEFAIVLEQDDEKLELVQLMHQLSKSISQPYEHNERVLQVTASLGLAVYANDGEDANTLVMHANHAMRIAKEDGGSCFRFFQPAMTIKMTRRIQLEHELRQALNAEGQLMLFYQPKVSLKTGEIIGVEALIRWRHPEEGMLSPAEFIPIAEDSGLIVELGDWVLVQAMWQLREWQKQDIYLEMAINVSVKQLMRRNISDRLLALAEQMDIEPRYVQIEITESNIMDNMSQIMGQLVDIEKNGFVLAIDDFGTGHSSLARLRDLPFKVLKIDRSFVMNAVTDAKDQQLVAAIVDIGHSLNKTVIAEGVETTEQQKLLQSLGCEEGQGYLYAKPNSAKQLASMLQQRKIALEPR